MAEIFHARKIIHIVAKGCDDTKIEEQKFSLALLCARDFELPNHSNADTGCLSIEMY